MTSKSDVSLPINAITRKVGTLPLHAALARSSLRGMNGPAADDDGNAAAAESAAPAAGVDTLFAQVYDRLKGTDSGLGLAVLSADAWSTSRIARTTSDQEVGVENFARLTKKWLSTIARFRPEVGVQDCDCAIASRNGCPGLRPVSAIASSSV